MWSPGGCENRGRVRKGRRWLFADPSLIKVCSLLLPVFLLHTPLFQSTVVCNSFCTYPVFFPWVASALCEGKDRHILQNEGETSQNNL